MNNFAMILLISVVVVVYLHCINHLLGVEGKLMRMDWSKAHRHCKQVKHFSFYKSSFHLAKTNELN